jgi:DNA-binding GntR family transcriptional regulator
MPAKTVDKSQPADPLTTIRNAILDGRIFPNERLVEGNLAQQLSTSRTAIRLALAVLEQQGLVIRERNHGARVRQVSNSDAIEIMELRSVLESLAARHAALKATPADIAKLRSMLKTLEAAGKDGDLTRFSTLNLEFHAEIIKIAQHENVTKLIKGLRAQIIVFQYRPIHAHGRIQQISKEHRKLVAAIASRSGDAAEVAMREHLDKSVDALRTVIQDDLQARKTRVDA